jgi:hypothetical protein
MYLCLSIQKAKPHSLMVLPGPSEQKAADFYTPIQNNLFFGQHFQSKFSDILSSIHKKESTE